MTREGDGSHLLRVLGVMFGVAVVIGGTIGQGVLRTPGLVAEGIRSPAIIVGLWIVVGVIAAIDAMSTVELASSIRKTGGPYAFATRAFGPVVGLGVGITDWLGNMAGIAFIAVVFGEYMHRLGLATIVPLGVLAPLIIAAVGVTHLLGTRASGWSQEIGSAIKALIFIALVVVLLLAPRAAPVATLTSDGMTAGLTLSGIVVALRAIVGTYTGWNGAAYFCEEVRDPRRDIARATFSGIALVTVIYVLVNVALLRVMTPAEMAGSNLVAADAAARVFGPAADTVVTAISLISLITIINAMMMVFPRVLFAVARDAKVAGLSHVAANGTPRAALFATIAAAALLATVGVYELLLAFSAALIAAMGICVNAAAIVVRRREPDLERPYRMPLFPLPALLALAINGALFTLFVHDDPATAAKAFAALAVLTGGAYLATRRRIAAT